MLSEMNDAAMSVCLFGDGGALYTLGVVNEWFLSGHWNGLLSWGAVLKHTVRDPWTEHWVHLWNFFNFYTFMS